MKRLLFALLFLFMVGMNYAQVDVTASGGDPNESYATLKAAFDSINTGFHSGTITIGISGNTTETATAVLNASGTGSASYTGITISPSGGAARLISGAITAGSPLIDLNGADNVTFDGLNSGGNSLTISNTTASATSGTSTIRFIADATNNTITNCTVLGSFSGSVATNGGNIFFSTGTTTGNDGNTISNCDITSAGVNLTTKGILGNGTTTSTAVGNSGIVINNNNIYDFFGAAVTSSGIAINGGCNTWTITNNRFYQTATRTWTTGATHRAIDLNSSTTTSGVQGMTVTGNIIGYASNSQTGTYTLTGSTGKFQGIYFNGITGATVSNINSNTVASVSLTGVTSSGTSTSTPMGGIIVNNGLAITNSNTIGSQSATGSLTFSTTTTSSTDAYGIFNFSLDDWTANFNNIGGISVTNLGASGTFLVYSMRANTSTSKVFNATSNNVGGTIANSIQLTSTGTSSQVFGMMTSNAISTWTSNTVRNLTNNNGTGTTTSASVIGMSLTTTSVNQTLSQNTIYNLNNTNTTAATTVTGIQFTGSTANVVERNFIYALTSATNSTTAEINGIKVSGGTTTYRNNMIAIGAGITNAIGSGVTNGISGINGFLGTDNFYHNSVFIDGAPTAGSGPSWAFNSTQTVNTRSFRDNIFFNARSNSGATGKNYIVRVGGSTPNPTGLTINNNVYFANGTGAVFGYFNLADVANLAAWKTAVGQDANSFESNPQYNNPTAATPDLHIHPTNVTVIEGNGVDLGVVNDYDGQTRSGLTPVDIGADAGNFTGNDITPPIVAYTPLSNTISTSSRTLTATITDNSSVPTSDPGMPRLYWKINFGGSYSAITPSYLGSNQYQYTGIGSGVSAGDTVYYYFVARDLAGTPNVGSAPGGASGFTYDPPAASTPPASPSYYNIISVISSFPYTQDFEAKATTWSSGIFSGSVNDWVIGTPAKTQISGAHGGTKAYVTGLTGNTAVSENAYVLSPHFDFSSLTNPVLSFWQNFLTENNYDACIVEYSSDFGATWRRVDSTLGTGGNFNTLKSTNWYNNTSTSGPIPPFKFSNTSTAYTGHSSGWIKSTTDLVALSGQIVQFRFRYGADVSTSLEGWALDDIEIKNLDVANPATFTATPFSSTQIDLSFTTNANNDTVVIVWNSTGTFTDPVGAPPSAGGSLAGGTVLYKGKTSPQSHSSLTPATTYFYKAFSYNGSLYSGGSAINASTLCGVLTSFTQNFDAVTVPALPTCWVKVGTGGSASTQSTSANSAPNCLYIYASSTTSLPVVRMPELSNAGAGTHILKFKARANFTVGGVIQIGYLTNPNDSSTFVKVDSIVASALTYNDYSLNLGTAPGSYTYLAFRHTGSPANSVLIDDVVWEALVAMAVDSTTTTQNTADVGLNQTNQQIIGVRVYTTGTLTPLSVSNFNLNTNGTTNAAVDITNAKVFYTGTSGTFAAVNQFGSTVASPSGAFSISGSQTLATGANYFWLTYDIPSGATPDNLADAECNQITIGSNYVPTVQAPAGARTIRGPLNGSYNVGLTPFNNAANRNLTVGKLTRKTEQWVYELNENVQTTKKNSGFVELPFAPEKAGKMELFDEEYAVLMENGQLYSGELSIKFKKELPTENGSQFIEAETFATLTAAISALNSRGVSGPVTFVLKDTSYSASETFPLNVNPVIGGSATNTVTIKPFTGVTATISGAAASSKIFNINSSNIIIDGSNSGGTSRDLTITNTSTTSPTTINIGSPGTSAITNITVKNCIVINGANTSSAIVVGDGDTTGNAGYFNDVIIQNNSIQKAYIGIYNKAVLQSGNGSGLKILNNNLTTSGANAIRYMGTYLQDITGAEVSGNSFANFETTSSEDDKGIYLYNTINSLIEKNNIFTLKYTSTSGYGPWGIGAYGATVGVNNIIKNNMISDLSGDGYDYTSTTFWKDNVLGIVLFGTQSGAKVYHNSVNLIGNTLNAANALSAGIALGTGTSADVRNNIIVNNLGLSGALGYGSTGIFLQTGASQLEQANFNNYVVSPTGAGVKNIGQIATTGYTTLSAWRTATGKEQYSTNNTVTFAGATDLHLSGGSILDPYLACKSLASVTTDFDGNTRGTIFAYKGADEATLFSVKTLNLTAMVEGLCDGTNTLSDTLAVELRNTSSPYGVVDKDVVVLNTNGNANAYFVFPVDATNYYIALRHRNALQTWSASGGQAFSSGSLSYDFTTAATQAYNSNMILVGSKYCIFSGDVSDGATAGNQDGYIDIFDDLEIYNDSYGGTYRWVTDLNNDTFVDIFDDLLVYNNSYNGIYSQYPGFPRPGYLKKDTKKVNVEKKIE